ncbi:MAG: YraN family protein, partial [Ignavibacterium sp.]
IASQFLLQKGLESVERNYFHGHGEIDIIAIDPRDNYLVFVEVKTRYSLEYGDPAYAINKKKIGQIKKVAELYLADKNIQQCDCRFDVITVLLSNPNNPQIEHYENAFI